MAIKYKLRVILPLVALFTSCAGDGVTYSPSGYMTPVDGKKVGQKAVEPYTGREFIISKIYSLDEAIEISTREKLSTPEGRAEYERLQQISRENGYDPDSKGKSGFASALGSALEGAVGAVGVLAGAAAQNPQLLSGSSPNAGVAAQQSTASNPSSGSSYSGHDFSGGTGSTKVQVSPPRGQVRAVREWSDWRTVQEGLRYRIFRISETKNYNELIGQTVVSNESLYMYKYQIEVDNQLGYKVDFYMELKQPDRNTNEIKLQLRYVLQVDANSKNGRGLGDVDKNL